MPKKIKGSPQFIKKIEEIFSNNNETSVTFSWRETSSKEIEIGCSIEQVDLLVDNLNQLVKKGKQLTGKTSRGQIWFLAQDIILIEAFGNEVETMINKQRILLDKKLYEYETELADEGFIRIGKSVLINTNRIESVASAYNGKLLLYMDNQEKIHVNRSYNKHFKEMLNKRRG